MATVVNLISSLKAFADRFVAKNPGTVELCRSINAYLKRFLTVLQPMSLLRQTLPSAVSIFRPFETGSKTVFTGAPAKKTKGASSSEIFLYLF